MIKGFSKLFKIYPICQLEYKLFKICINGSKQVKTGKNWLTFVNKGNHRIIVDKQTDTHIS